MSYTVLARRYRSGTFDEVVGQDHVAQTLKKAIESERLAHAYLFCGTRGTGKTSMARIMAKCLNCESSDSPTTKPCGKCNSCLAIARGDDIDVIEIDAASNTGVDNVRDIIENSQYRPARSRFKVYIIDEVHMLSKSAFNALLKTLEEPPSHVKFILATTEPEKVLPTILSRCQRYDFRNIPTREIADHLKEISKKEKIKAEDDALMLVAKAGAGSMRDSLSLLDRLLSIGEKELTVERIEQLLGMPRAAAIVELTQSIGEGDVKQTLTKAGSLIQNGLSPDTLLASLVDHLRNLLILRACGSDSNLIEVPGLSIKELQQQAERFDPIVLTQDITILEELRRQLRTSQAGRALLDATLVRLALAEQFTQIGELLDQVSGNGSSSSAARPVQKKKPEVIQVEVALESEPEPEPESVAATEPVPAPEPVAPSPPPVVSVSINIDEEDDDLPRPGKVWDNSGPSLAELLKQQLKTSVAVTPAPSDAVESAQPHAEVANVEPIVVENLGDVWQRLLDALGKKSASLPPLLDNAELVGIEENQAIIRFAHRDAFRAKTLDRNGKKDTVRDALCAVIGQTVGLKIDLAPPTEADQEPAAAPVVRPSPPRVQKPAPVEAPVIPEAPTIRLTTELREELRQKNPLIDALVRDLGAEIVKVEPPSN
ncbi:MAG TPA: DNA polymerase III subunit gamma/tau [Tepidisphaeraceae bacterium]|jgi:DNA polymerase-3 subunit gamma/tau|nr:DNA polymerase III subunit gamma/tau [Tepidisphaeraceae bacterium]